MCIDAAAAAAASLRQTIFTNGQCPLQAWGLGQLPIMLSSITAPPMQSSGHGSLYQRMQTMLMVKLELQFAESAANLEHELEDV